MNASLSSQQRCFVLQEISINTETHSWNTAESESCLKWDVFIKPRPSRLGDLGRRREWGKIVKPEVIYIVYESKETMSSKQNWKKKSKWKLSTVFKWIMDRNYTKMRTTRKLVIWKDTASKTCWKIQKEITWIFSSKNYEQQQKQKQNK